MLADAKKQFANDSKRNPNIIFTIPACKIYWKQLVTVQINASRIRVQISILAKSTETPFPEQKCESKRKIVAFSNFMTMHETIFQTNDPQACEESHGAVI
ncbi:Hypothetical_protein [Hexamita inflata]|uniref:Hypothetical_protein n=1 Tax=Hexamita inflata TaxID=28002 RepID=A0AA86QQT8_9EUKA|nr:Hypothetical protein HINF_LOCUS45953 [Hexamita inflata]